MSPTLNIPASKKILESGMSFRHNRSFYEPIANVLAYLSKKHARDCFERDMSWLLSRHKYSTNGRSEFRYAKLHYSKDDLINKVTSLEGRKYFALLAAYHPMKGDACFEYDLSLLTGNVAYQKSLLSRLVRDLGSDAAENSDSTFAYCRAFLMPIFDYDAFREGKIPTCKSSGKDFEWVANDGGGWCCAEFIRGLGVKYCVYCNADSVYSFNIKGGRALPYASALDHFLPRHLHPYFALNLYNLVPCCTRCNTSLKGKKETDFQSYASPYSDDLYGSFKVRAYHNMKEVGRVVGGDTSRLQVKYIPLECDTTRRVARLMLELFKWEDVYNGIFSEEVKDIFRKTRLLTPAYKMWMKAMNVIGVNSDRLLYGCSMRRSEVCRYRFAKVIQDFAERYGGVTLKD